MSGIGVHGVKFPINKNYTKSFFKEDIAMRTHGRSVKRKRSLVVTGKEAI